MNFSFNATDLIHSASSGLTVDKCTDWCLAQHFYRGNEGIMLVFLAAFALLLTWLPDQVKIQGRVRNLEWSKQYASYLAFFCLVGYLGIRVLLKP